VDACQELGRCLSPGAIAIFATKSRDSYSELEALADRAGLSPFLHDRGMYDTFHSDNFASAVAQRFSLSDVWHEQNVFHVTDASALASFLLDSPNLEWRGVSREKAYTRLVRAMPAGGVTFTSRLSFCVARRAEFVE
jgi:hypothetical protein